MFWLILFVILVIAILVGKGEDAITFLVGLFIYVAGIVIGLIPVVLAIWFLIAIFS